ncbi:MAG: lipoate--protein ligase family protein [Verrucomicrobia bacterium]|nr:lipoate--protein ligase family protein [Verrucomicrobiota bacterium]
MNILSYQGMPIAEQLKIEEELLRHDTQNICLINEGTPPTIVMGISGKAEELVDQTAAEKQGIPVIRRFSGGGTVIVDEETIFVTFIFNTDVHDFPAYPEPILRWAGNRYQDIFGIISLRENDFVIGEKKCGGNALYIRKNRWLLHTSFLWDYKPERMALLHHPKKTPTYRSGRNHEEFCTRLSTHFAHSKRKWLEAFEESVRSAASPPLAALPCR